MRNIDLHIRSLHQAAYDYVWDRWGIYVGTFRTWLIVLAFADSILGSIFRMFALGKSNLIALVASEILTFALIWFMFARRHLGKEWNAQHENHLNALNKIALENQASGRISRIIYVVVMIIVVSLPDTVYEIAIKTLAIGFLFSWSYGWEVMVRDRDRDRFATRRLASHGI